MRTLFLNPPSYANFDAGAGSRWAATREVRSFWYPVWLAYPAGFLKDSRLLDAPPANIGVEETIRIAKDYALIVLYTSTPGLQNDFRLAQDIKQANPGGRIAFVGPHPSVLPGETLRDGEAVDFVVRREFDYAIKDFAEGRPIGEIPNVSYRENGKVRHNPQAPPLEDLDALPYVTQVYKRDLNIHDYEIPWLKKPYVSFYTGRGCPKRCTFCLWPQTFSGHTFRVRSVENVIEEVKLTLKLFPEVKEVYFDDDTFTILRKRVHEICRELKKIGLTWSGTSVASIDAETLKIMADSGCRALLVGYESGNQEILNHLKKGITLRQAREFTHNCKRVGIRIHGAFILGMPGETRATIEETIRFACELDVETIQVSLAQPLPGTAFHEELQAAGALTGLPVVDAQGHQVVNYRYHDLSDRAIFEAQERFYKRYYLRPRYIARVLRDAIFDREEQKRLYREGKEFFKYLRERKQVYQGAAAN